MDESVRLRLGPTAAVGALAAGLALAVVMVVSGGSGSQPGPLRACSEANSSLAVVGARLEPDGRRVRLAYAGAEPCQFAAARHKGRLYVELRTDTELGEVDRRPPVPAGCVEGTLERPVRSGTPLEPIYGNENLVPEDEIASLLAPGAECREVVQGQPAFVID